MATSVGNPVDLSQYVGTATDQAYKNWKNQEDQMKWAKDQFAKNEGVSDTVTNRALDTSQAFTGDSRRDRALYDEMVPDAMRQQMAFAKDYTTPSRMAANRGAAMAQSRIGSGSAVTNAQNALRGFDIDPSAGRFAGLDAGLEANAAAKAAAAGTKSDRDTETLGQQYLANAIQTGQVLPGQAVNEAGMGVAAGNQAVNSRLATTASGAATMGTPLQWNAQGNEMIKEWPKALLGQTALGLQQNRDTAMENLAQQKLANESSSGIGATIGAVAGGLGGVAKLAGGFGSLGEFGGGATGTPTTGGSGPYSGGATGSPAGASVPGYENFPGQIYTSRHGGLIPRYAKGGIAHDLLGTAGSVAGNMLFPVVGGMVGKFAGNALGDVIEGNTGNIGGDAERDFTFGIADPDKPGGAGAPTGLPGWGQFAKMFGLGGGGGGPQPDGTIVDNWGGDGVGMGMADMGDAGFAFQEGGMEPDDQMGDGQSNMVPPEASPSGGAETDDVHALLNEGEFVVPKDVSSWLGEKFLQGMIEKARKEMAGPKAEPEMAPAQAMALSPPSFASEGARGQA